MLRTSCEARDLVSDEPVLVAKGTPPLAKRRGKVMPARPLARSPARLPSQTPDSIIDLRRLKYVILD
jgi:hypothetical protein